MSRHDRTRGLPAPSQAASVSDARVWLALEGSGGKWLTRGEVERLAGVSDQCAYFSLIKLASLGLVERVQLGRPYYYRVHEPNSEPSQRFTAMSKRTFEVLGLRLTRRAKSKAA